MAKPQNITIACTIMGVPRKTSIYAASIQSLIFLSQNNTLFFGDGIVRQTAYQNAYYKTYDRAYERNQQRYIPRPQESIRDIR